VCGKNKKESGGLFFVYIGIHNILFDKILWLWQIMSNLILGVTRTKRAWLSIMGPKILLVLLTYYDMA
jgi:hypothetical protein